MSSLGLELDFLVFTIANREPPVISLGTRASRRDAGVPCLMPSGRALQWAPVLLRFQCYWGSRTFEATERVPASLR